MIPDCALSQNEDFGDGIDGEIAAGDEISESRDSV